MTPFLTLAQITDTHLLEHPNDLLRGYNPLQNLKTVLHEVARHQPDGLLLTGDLADQGSTAAYEHLQAALSEFDCPVYWLPGNHDDLANLQSVLRSSQYYPPQAIDLGSGDCSPSTPSWQKLNLVKAIWVRISCSGSVPNSNTIPIGQRSLPCIITRFPPALPGWIRFLYRMPTTCWRCSIQPPRYAWCCLVIFTMLCSTPGNAPTKSKWNF